MKLNPILARRAELGGAIVDLLELGVSAELMDVDETQFERARHELTRAGALDVSKSASGGRYNLYIKIPNQPGMGDTEDTAQLSFVSVGGGRFRIASSSLVRLHPMRYLRRQLGLGHDWPDAYDGNDNFIGEMPADCTALFAAQCDYISAAIERLVDLLARAFPEQAISSQEMIWLRKIEITRDFVAGNVQMLAELLAYSTLRRARWRDVRIYGQGASCNRGHSVARWWLRRNGPTLKAYGKAPALARAEVSCLDRVSVVQLTGAVQLPMTGDGAARLVVGYMEAALPLLASLYEHIIDVAEGALLPSELSLMLLPLLLRMTGASTGGRAVAPAGVAEFHRAYSSLILTGSFDAPGLRQGTALRRELDALCGSDGPLIKHPTRCFYTLKPSCVSAGFALAQASSSMGATR